MSKKKVFLITEGGSGIGFGHVIRCLALYQSFIYRDADAHLVIYGDSSIDQFLDDCNVAVLDWLHDGIKLIDIIKGADIAVIDSYLADLRQYTLIKDNSRVSAYIDDYKRLDYPEGIIINGSIGANAINYPRKDDVEYLLGPEYQALRKEFWALPEKIINEKVKSVMITFGGEDLRRLTPRILKLLNNQYPGLIKYVIIGKGYQHINEIEKISNEKTKLLYYPGASEMKEIMLEADFAISSGGQTLYELACVGVPTIAISTAQNQLININGWGNLNSIFNAGWWENANLLDTTDVLIKKIHSYSLRQQMRDAGRKAVNDRGGIVIVDYLLSRIK